MKPNLVLVAAMLGWSAMAGASDWSFRGPHDAVPHNVEEYVWKDESIELPEYPDKEQMLEIEFGRPDARYRYFLDPKTLRVADNDVVHYVVLLRSRSGSENLMYEGIHCQNGTYRTMAYGTRTGEFRPLRNPQWKAINRTSNNWFRAELQRRYFCTRYRLDPITAQGILDRIKYPPPDLVD